MKLNLGHSRIATLGALVALISTIMIGCADEVGRPGDDPRLARPDDFRVVGRTSDDLVLAWEVTTRDADGYELERIRAADGRGDTILVAGGSTARYVDRGLGERRAFTYRLRTWNRDKQSAWTEPVLTRTLPAAPDSLVAVAMANNQILLDWAMEPPHPSGFEIMRREAGFAWEWLVTVPGSERSHSDVRVELGKSYEYRARAFVDADSSAWSTTAPADNDGYSTGPAGLIERLSIAFERRDVDLYASIISYDFTFRFSRGDRESHPEWPRVWGADWERSAFERLCSDPNIELLSVELIPGRAGLPDVGSSAPYGTWVLDLEVRMVLRTRDDTNQVREFDVHLRNSTLFVRPPTPDPTGGPWTLAEWRERDDDSHPSSDTWGEIKQHYLGATAVPIVHRLGVAQGVSPPPAPEGCGTLMMNSDSEYERAYGWGGLGAIGAQGGAFAECYTTAPAALCSASFDLTQNGSYRDQTMDVLLWKDDHGMPGEVLFIRRGVRLGPIAEWPEVSRHLVPIATPATGETWWIGFVGNWRGEQPGWFIAADIDGFGGCAVTYASGSSGYSSGWHSVTGIFGATMALGIGADVNPAWK